MRIADDRHLDATSTTVMFALTCSNTYDGPHPPEPGAELHGAPIIPAAPWRGVCRADDAT